MTLTIHRRRLLLGIPLIVALTVLTLIAGLRVYLATPHAARQVGEFLSRQLHQTVQVARLETSQLGIQLSGVSLANPAGFSSENLASADKITIIPRWPALLAGKQNIEALEVQGLKLDLRKNSAGEWNYAHIQQRFTGRKKGGGRLFIGRLTIRDAALNINGSGPGAINLQLFNLSSANADPSRINISFEDSARSHYSISGTVRGGSDPTADLLLSAPALSFSAAAAMLGLPPTRRPLGTGNLRAHLTLHQQLLSINARLGFRDLLPPNQRVEGWGGTFEMIGDYHLSTDQARLQRASLDIAGLTVLTAQGSVNQLRHEAEFQLSATMTDTHLAHLLRLVPEPKRKGLALDGRLAKAELQLAGNRASGVTTATGNISMRDGAITRDGRRLAQGVDGSVRITNAASGFLLKGQLRAQPQQGAVVTAFNTPFQARFSRHLTPLAAECAPLTATISGVPLHGGIVYDKSRSLALRVDLQTQDAALAQLNPLLGKTGLSFTSGIASADLQLSGSGLSDFRGTSRIGLANALLVQAGRQIAITKGRTDWDIQRKQGRFALSGQLELSGRLDTRPTAVASEFRFADERLSLSKAGVTIAGTSIRIAEGSLRLPRPDRPDRLPLEIELSGGAIAQGDLAVNGIAARGHTEMANEGSRRWLEGSLSLWASQAAWQGHPLAAPTARIEFARTGARALLGGKLLDGQLAGTVAFQPLGPKEPSTFELRVDAAQIAAAGELTPRTWALRPGAGKLDLVAKGSYASPDGIKMVVSARGGDIVLTGKSGKAAVTGAGMDLAGEFSGNRLALQRGIFTAGEAFHLSVNGNLDKASSPERSGRITFHISEAPLSALVDPFVNILPRLAQEGTFTGSLSADGQLELGTGKKLLSGSMHVADAGLEAPEHKLVLDRVSGEFPFSLDLTGKTSAPPRDSFSRDNFPRLLQRLQRESTRPATMRIGRIESGSMKMQNVALHTEAANGITRVVLQGAGIFDGSLFGEALLSMAKVPSLRSDLLIHGLSLRQLCASFPAIKGYIAGAVDGIVSLKTEEGGMQGLSGFTHLWARETNREPMTISREFLQRLSGKKLSGFFFRNDRPYDHAEIVAMLKEGYLSFETLDIRHTNLFGVRDLSVSIAATQNRIALDHLLSTIREAATRGKPAVGTNSASEEKKPEQPPVEMEFKWQE